MWRDGLGQGLRPRNCGASSLISLGMWRDLFDLVESRAKLLRIKSYLAGDVARHGRQPRQIEEATGIKSYLAGDVARHGQRKSDSQTRHVHQVLSRWGCGETRRQRRRQRQCAAHQVLSRWGCGETQDPLDAILADIAHQVLSCRGCGETNGMAFMSFYPRLRFKTYLAEDVARRCIESSGDPGGAPHQVLLRRGCGET